MILGRKGFTVKHTLFASYIAYVVQAIVINFVPLLFVTFRKDYGLTLEMLTLIVTINFIMQLTIDAVSVFLIDRLGYRLMVVLAHVTATLGLVGLAFLPELLAPNYYVGILISTLMYAVGGGLIEVVISPIVEACPTEGKAANMSLLHSFYSWGMAIVALVSAVFFAVFGVENWKILSCIWALVPLFNGILYAVVPLYELNPEGGQKGVTGLFKMKFFWLMLVLMFGAGAAEQAISQWASAYSEVELGISKAIGDIAGPCAFGILMGSSRVFYAKFSKKLKLSKFMLVSAFVCLASYFLAAFSPMPMFGLLGCAICGLAVGIMWPGTYSLAAGAIKNGGTAMFAILALAGDAGCTFGPTLVGFVSGIFDENIRIGFLTAAVFPAVIIVGVIIYNRFKAKMKRENKEE